MGVDKPMSIALVSLLKLSKKQSPLIEHARTDMAKVLYASTISNLMHAMVCIRLDIVNEVGVLSRYMINWEK